MSEAKAKTEKAPKAPKAVKEKAPKIERERQNGHTRPLAGSKTGLIWDLADAISQKERRPALRDEVFDAYDKKVKDASMKTAGTQYSRWCAFHGVSAKLKEFKEKDRAEKDAAKAKVKADAKAKADAEKKAKDAKAAEKQKKAA